jgi:uncharacterized damage-inducible protein DinB
MERTDVITSPDPAEYAPYFGRYIEEARAAGSDPVALMKTQLDSTGALLDGVSEERSTYRYAPGKWSIREIAGHLIDAERIFGCRALRLARGDQAHLPGFDENEFVAAANFDARTLRSLTDEWRHVRRATIALFEGLTEEPLARTGTASNGPMSARALAWIIPGHERHHADVLRARYLGGRAA